MSQMPKRVPEDGPRRTPVPPLRAQRLSSAIGAVVDAADLDEAGHDGPSQLRQRVIDHHVVFVRGFLPAGTASMPRYVAPLSNDEPIRPAPPLAPTKLGRRLLAKT